MKENPPSPSSLRPAAAGLPRVERLRRDEGKSESVGGQRSEIGYQ
jgi:hypothetical protein